MPKNTKILGQKLVYTNKVTLRVTKNSNICMKLENDFRLHQKLITENYIGVAQFFVFALSQ